MTCSSLLLSKLTDLSCFPFILGKPLANDIRRIVKTLNAPLRGVRLFLSLAGPFGSCPGRTRLEQRPAPSKTAQAAITTNHFGEASHLCCPGCPEVGLGWVCAVLDMPMCLQDCPSKQPGSQVWSPSRLFGHFWSSSGLCSFLGSSRTHPVVTESCVLYIPRASSHIEAGRIDKKGPAAALNGFFVTALT